MQQDRRIVLGGLIGWCLGACASTRAPTTNAGPTRHQFRARDGALLSYLRIGRGRPVILLHGFLANAQLNWFDNGVAQCLAERGAMVIAPDFRGHGFSARPETPYPADVLATDQEDLIRHLRLRQPSVGGYSLGARMALRLAVRGLSSRRLAVGGMGDTGMTSPALRQAFFEDLIRNGGRAANPRAGLFVQEMMRRTGVTAGPMLRVLAQQRVTSPAELARVRTPVSLICGTEDRDNGSPEALAGLLPAARLIPVPGDHLGAIRTAEFRNAFCRELLA